DFALRASYPEAIANAVDSIRTFQLTKTGGRSYRFISNDAREVVRLLDVIERIVLRPGGPPAAAAAPAAPGAPAVAAAPPPRDTTPAESVAGVLEVTHARELLQR